MHKGVYLHHNTRGMQWSWICHLLYLWLPLTWLILLDYLWHIIFQTMHHAVRMDRYFLISCYWCRYFGYRKLSFSSGSPHFCIQQYH
jgi:hypothetical protein